jgi:hypothetical protein
MALFRASRMVISGAVAIARTPDARAAARAPCADEGTARSSAGRPARASNAPARSGANEAARNMMACAYEHAARGQVCRCTRCSLTTRLGVIFRADRSASRIAKTKQHFSRALLCACRRPSLPSPCVACFVLFLFLPCCGGVLAFL